MTLLSAVSRFFDVFVMSNMVFVLESVSSGDVKLSSFTCRLYMSGQHRSFWTFSATERSLCRSPDKFSLLWNFAGDQLKLSRPWLHHGAPTYCTHVYCHLSTVHTVGHGYFLVLHVFDLSSSMENPCFCSRLCSVIYYSSYTLMQNGSWPGLVAGFIVLIHIL